MADKEWLDSLKDGDEVCLSGTYGRSGEIVRLTGASPHFLKIGTSRYRRKDGRAVSTDTWNRRYLHPVTDGIRERIEHEGAVDFLRHIQWDRVPRETVLTVRRLYQEALAEQEQKKAAAKSQEHSAAGG